MARVYGWSGGALAHDEALEALAAMHAHDPAAGPRIERLELHSAVVAVADGSPPADVFRTERLLVAAEGRLRCLDGDVAAVAKEAGCAAAVARLYERHGADFLSRLTGSFALALVDRERHIALLAVDRVGIRPLCYAVRGNTLVFGSTAESVAAHPRVGRKLSDQALFNYLYCHDVPSPATIYENVRKLLPAQCVTFRDGQLEQRFYWQLDYAEHHTEPLASLERRFLRLLREALTCALGEDERVGAFLSGGTDSSTVAGLLTEISGRPARTYSIGFSAQGFDEMGYARIAARHFGTAAHEYYATPQDVLEAIPLIARSYDEPFGNASAVPTYLCARMARADGIEVMLAGDGGDEIFGGNSRYAWQKLFEPYASVPRFLRTGVIEPVIFGWPIARLSLGRKLRSYIAQARIPLPDRLESYNILQPASLADIFEPSFVARVDPDEPLILQREAYHRAASRSAVDRMMHLDLKFTLADNDLRKVGRMCEVAGLEVRFPLLDDRLVEFSGEIPASLKIRGLKLRWFFKHALRDFLPAQILAKIKHGFGLPFGLWLREHKGLADMAHKSLEAFAERDIVRRDYIGRLLRQHETEHATYYGVMIWVLVMLEQWLAAKKF